MIFRTHTRITTIYIGTLRGVGSPARDQVQRAFERKSRFNIQQNIPSAAAGGKFDKRKYLENNNKSNLGDGGVFFFLPRQLTRGPITVYGKPRRSGKPFVFMVC